MKKNNPQLKLYGHIDKDLRLGDKKIIVDRIIKLKGLKFLNLITKHL